MTKYAIFILMLAALTLTGCKNDKTFYHDSSTESEKNGLLIDKYMPDEEYMSISNHHYKIVDAWTAYKFTTRDKKTIHKKNVAFTIILEDAYGKREPNLEIWKYLKCQNKGVLFGGFGIIDSQYRILFKNESLKELDTIKLEAGNSAERSTVKLVKQ